jgi:hypothetical protein
VKTSRVDSWPCIHLPPAPGSDTSEPLLPPPSGALHDPTSETGPAAVAAPGGASGSITERYPYQEPTGKKCLVFISHAGEQKEKVVVFVKEKLEQIYPALRGRVFLDDLSLERGDDAMSVIHESLRDAFVGAALHGSTFLPWLGCSCILFAC